MIQIDGIEIRELRGIRHLSLRPARKSFVISGPNGSGKSGVVDAIEFALTGEISRLAGKGTGGLTVLRHGPHVDRRDDPGAAEVALQLYLPGCDKMTTLTRNVKKAKEFTLEPDDPEIRAAVEEVAQHPELTLSRRDIIKYVIVEAGQRSNEVQALLRLDRVGQIRSVLRTMQTKLSTAHKTTESAVASAADALKRHLDLETLPKRDVLAVVNKQRKLLELPVLVELTTETALDEGVASGGADPAFNKKATLRDLAAIRRESDGLAGLCRQEADNLIDGLKRLEEDPALFGAIQHRSFIERGLALVDSPRCPLCDLEWDDVEHLRAHLAGKLAKSNEAEAFQKDLLKNAGVIVGQAQRLQALISAVTPVAEADGADVLLEQLVGWSARLDELCNGLGTVEGILQRREALRIEWAASPTGLSESLDTLTAAITAIPDQSATVAAQTFLVRAQERLDGLRRSRSDASAAKAALSAGQLAYKTYCDVADAALRSLYDAVEDDFSAYYRDINTGDEPEFKAKLESDEAKLDLKVDFYGTGMFPPAAYHSEGHQDGMGVCLYLALMKRVLGDNFRFAVLDDVVMSVDKEHRKQFCKLLASRFPDTQFIITTHDQIWAKQMRSEHLVGSNASVVFHGWSIQTGPVVEEVAEVWDQIEAALAKNDVPDAAGRLRRHLEYVASELADSLAARIPYHADASHDLGELLSGVIGRQGDLLKLAAKAANSWSDDDARAKVEALKTARAGALEQYGGESWAVNAAIHYNEWADFSKADFIPVVAAFRAVVSQSRCANPTCDSWLYVTPPKGDPQALRCPCAAVNLNLTAK